MTFLNWLGRKLNFDIEVLMQLVHAFGIKPERDERSD
jgi:hypothetical protein